MEEVHTLVLYDIEDDRIRNRIAERCKDFGLVRIQYSAFAGTLNRNKREELFLRLERELHGKPGKILVQPICSKDLKDSLVAEYVEQDDNGRENPNPSQ